MCAFTMWSVTGRLGDISLFPEVRGSVLQLLRCHERWSWRSCLGWHSSCAGNESLTRCGLWGFLLWPYLPFCLLSGLDAKWPATPYFCHHTFPTITDCIPLNCKSNETHPCFNCFLSGVWLQQHEKELIQPSLISRLLGWKLMSFCQIKQLFQNS